jgi:hypothetical protein
MTAQEAFLLARAYTDKAIEGGGALKGAACQIQSITAITGGHRITFAWEDNDGNVETDTMDVMDGTDGQAGVGISMITYKETDAQGNYVYTITLTSGSTYDITCPKGPQGATGATGADGADGQDGADGVGIASITKTGTSGLVDTYTITYTNGTTSTFTVTNGADADLTAGQYIEIDNDTISVKRDISKTAQQIEYNFTIPGDYTLRVKKYVQGDLVDTTDYQFNSVVDPINLDSIMEVSKKPGGGFYWVVKNLIASTTQAADYSVELYAFQTSTNYTQNFVATLDADKKLIIQSELDAALADKVDKVAGKGLSENDYTNADKAIVGGVTAALGEKADTDIVASDFDATASYTAGNYCIYEGKMYKFKASHSGAWSASDVDEIKIAGELSSLMRGLTKQVSNNITLPSTSNGVTTSQIETSVPSGAHIIGGCISNVSSYSDVVVMGVYYQGNYARVTCVSLVETTLPSITLNLITTYTV